MEKTYYFQDIIKDHNENPRKVLKPSDEEIKSLKAGQEVKLIFMLYAPLENGCTGERMWVQISEISGDKFKGYLMTRPSFIKDIQIGDILEFSKNNITAVTTKTNFDRTKTAVITKRALEMQQINWIVRDEPLDTLDSGWQLFYGDEDEEYTTDTNNATFISLVEVIGFEPLLEKVFASQHFAFEWNDQKMDFVEVHDFTIG